MSEKEKKAATPRGRKKKEVKEEHIASIGPDSSPELVHEEIGRAADVVSEKEAPKEEGDWGTFSDRGASVPDPMIEEGTGAPQPAKDENVPSLMGEDEQNEKPVGILEGEFTIQGEGDIKLNPKGTFTPSKPKGQMTLGGVPVPKATIWIKPQAVPYEIRTEKVKMNTTEEGFMNRKDTDTTELTQWVAKKVKVLKDATVRPGDIDKGIETIVGVIKGTVMAPKHYVGEDEDD
jgi:hypothetical protein